VTTVDDELTAGRDTDVTDVSPVAAGFTSIVVALDLGANGDRALPIVRRLAERSQVPVELLTVSSPGVDDAVDTYELRRRTTANGWPKDWYAIEHSNHPATAILDHLERSRGALLVMATSAEPLIKGRLFGNVVEKVLSELDEPVLLVGPRAPDVFPEAASTLVACIDHTDVADAAIPAITRWTRTFDGAEAWVTQVIAPDAAPAVRHRSPEHVRHFADRLTHAGVKASWGVLFGDPPDARLEQFADCISNPIFVTTSVRWTDGRPHWRSTAHQLVHRSTHPVLVVPAKAGHPPVPR
jgi:nucleotide-binding universal stress UspA family protein